MPHGTGLVELSGARAEGPWPLENVSFYSSGVVGRLCADTGASVTVVSLDFVRRAGLRVKPAPEGVLGRRVRLPTGVDSVPTGVVDVPVSVQVMVEEEGAGLVHWDRQFTLKDAWVLDLGADSPRDVYVSWADFRFDPRQRVPQSPLSQLAYLVACGARVVDSPRALPAGAERVYLRVGEALDPTVAAFVPSSERPSLREQLEARIPVSMRGTEAAEALLAGLLERARLFDALDPAECSEVVEFEEEGSPREVSFRAPVNRRAMEARAYDVLDAWVEKGVCERVPPGTPAYGFALMVPKPGGKFRLTMNPVGINSSTRREDPEGGYMPASMLSEVMVAADRRKVAVSLDLRDAFLMFKLGPTAQRLSTFTTPKGKYRWKHGWFGWHSFPGKFQKMMMELVVLPTLEAFEGVSILDWIDDIVVAADDVETLVRCVLSIADRILGLGGRLSLEKCSFLVTEFEWCGVQVDLAAGSWRISPGRVSSLVETPVPETREALAHVLGILRYYYFGVRDTVAQRARIATLAALDTPGVRLRTVWTEEHSRVMREALEAVSAGNWQLLFDASQPVWVETDASGNDGFGVVAYQADPNTGEKRPLAYFSKGWQKTQLTWTAQVKECYAQRHAVVKMIPSFFPLARVILLCDNKNLAAVAESEDPRVVRWQADIRHAGVVEQRHWIPGDRNSAADYASRSVRPNPAAVLSEEEEFDLHIFGLLEGGEGSPGAGAAGAGGVQVVGEGGVAPAGVEGGGQGTLGIGSSLAGDATVVPGHLPMAPLLASIVEAQLSAGRRERATWAGAGYETLVLHGRPLVLFRRRVVVPRDAVVIKRKLLSLAHDDSQHVRGGERTLAALQSQARVTWVGMTADAQEYVNSCFRCQFGKAASHSPTPRGTLSPTVAPRVHHTWVVDNKGIMPHKTGVLMAVTEALTRVTKLRYLRRGTAEEVIEEMEEVAASFGTYPAVIRCDGGQPFTSVEFKSFCDRYGIQLVVGVPYHSQGQGLVETRFRGIAGAIIATLGHKAPTDWWKGPLLAKLEHVINSTICEPIGGSPYWAMNAREPRSALSAQTDWTNTAFGEQVLGVEAASFEDYVAIIAAHHDALNAVQGRVHLATSLAQAMTKRRYDAARAVGDFRVGEWVLVHRTAPNRMLPHFTGPFQVTSVSGDGNFVGVRNFLEDAARPGLVHISRLLRFNMSRTTVSDLAGFQLEEGSFVVDSVIEHRTLADGTAEFHIRWRDNPITSWESGVGIRKVTVVADYCARHGIAAVRPVVAGPAARGRPGRRARGSRR